SLLATIQGLTYMYLWPGNVTLNDATLVLSLSGMIFFPTLFFRSFLSLPETRPVLSRVLLVFTCLSILTAAGGFFLPYRFMIVTTILLVLGAIMTGFTAGILRWLDGYHAAKYRSEEHTSELQSRENLVCRLLLEKKKKKQTK